MRNETIYIDQLELRERERKEARRERIQTIMFGVFMTALCGLLVYTTLHSI